MSALEFSSYFYSIQITSQFETAFEKHFKKNEQAAQVEDIKTFLKRLDVIGQYQKRWTREKKRFVELEKTKNGFSLCKAYIPITCRKLSSTAGARLFVAVKESNPKHQAIFVSIIPKSRIATGSKEDVSKKEIKRIFKEYK
ncbi:hypothetical protein ES708_11262 [subsurface metagenome]